MNINLKNNKAITLIALVVTIVVILILAGISIGTISGREGLITQAKTAEESSRGKYVQECIERTAVENEKKELYGEEIVTKEDLISSLVAEGKLTTEEANILESSDTIDIGEITVNFGKLKIEAKEELEFTTE